MLLIVGLGLELIALYCYAPLMKAALGDAGLPLSLGRLFRIQMSTRALSSIVPGGSAASSALGYRLIENTSGKRVFNGDNTMIGLTIFNCIFCLCFR